jgi:hypothetical protein
MLPRTLPIAVLPARHETIASYLARLAALHGLDGDDLWKQVSHAHPCSANRRHSPAVRANRSPGRHATRAPRPAPDLGSVPPHPADRLPALRRPPPGRAGVSDPAAPPLRLHAAPVLDRPPDINDRGPHLEIVSEVVAAQRRHVRLVRRHGWVAVYDAVLTTFMICANLWEKNLDEGDPDSGAVALNQAVWDARS